MDVKKPLIIYISSSDEEEEVESSTAGESDGDDDDCVILDEDPNKPLKLVNENGSNDSDDLIVVSETGQVACRDYPHPRHLCVKFPFATTPHESHCDKCNCYVCDTFAPCLFWGKEYPLTHCDATDKIWIWRKRREIRKRSDLNQSPPLAQSVSNSVTQNQLRSEGPEGTLQNVSLSRTHETPNIEHPGCRQTAYQRTEPLVNLQNKSSSSPRPFVNPHDLSSEFDNLNLDLSNTNLPHVVESEKHNQLRSICARNTSVSQPTNLKNQNDQPSSNPNSSKSYTSRVTDTNSQTHSNPRPKFTCPPYKSKWSTRTTWGS